MNILKHRNAGDPKDGHLRWENLHSAAGFYKDRPVHGILFFFPQLKEDHAKQIELLKYAFGPECIVTTPSQASDDSFMLSYAKLMRLRGFDVRIVTNDLFRDFVSKGVLQQEDPPALTVKYAFAAGLFVPEDLGK